MKAKNEQRKEETIGSFWYSGSLRCLTMVDVSHCCKNLEGVWQQSGIREKMDCDVTVNFEEAWMGNAHWACKREQNWPACLIEIPSTGKRKSRLSW